MRRIAPLLITGATVAALALHWATRTPNETGTAAVPSDVSGLQAAVPPERAPRPFRVEDFVAGARTTTQRAALYQLAAQSDGAALRALARSAAMLPATQSRRFALEVLLSRYAELDPRAAVRLAHELNLEPEALAPLYRSWASTDSAAALLALGSLDEPRAAAIGIGLLQVFGNNDAGIERILAAAPVIDAVRFRLEAAIDKARSDPRAAVRDAQRLPPPQRSAATARIAELWAQHDARDALQHVGLLGDHDLRAEFQVALFRAWALSEPEAMLSYVLDLDPVSQQSALRAGGLQAFAQIDPARALDVAQQLGGEVARMVRRVALINLSRTDSIAALRYADALPPGVERAEALQTIAVGYARTDPEAALVWAQSLQPPMPSVVANVLQGLARVAPERAIDLVFQMSAPAEQMRVFQMLVMSGAIGANDTSALADRLAATPGRRQGLQTLANMWAQRAPQEALQWLFANPEHAPSAAFAQVAERLGRSDPSAAIEYLHRIPNELRGSWLGAVAAGHAQANPQAAASWVLQYRGHAGYEAAVAAVARSAARYDPPDAARLLGSIDMARAAESVSAAASIAAQWAQQAPRAAAQWATDLAHGEARSRALVVVAEQWSQQDAAAARAWAVGLRFGPERDAALAPVLANLAAAHGTVEPSLLNAFSSEQAQQTALSQAVAAIAQRDAAAARRFADEHITDPHLRRYSERFIVQPTEEIPTSQLGPAVSIRERSRAGRLPGSN